MKVVSRRRSELFVSDNGSHICVLLGMHAYRFWHVSQECERSGEFYTMEMVAFEGRRLVEDDGNGGCSPHYAVVVYYDRSQNRWVAVDE
jgi:hypothetical protein